MEYRLERDANGDLRAQTPAPNQLLGRYLEADVQGSTELCRTLLQAIDEILDGRKKRRQFIGNAHSLSLTAQRARIQPEFSPDPPLDLPLQTLKTVLQEWQDLIDPQ